MNIENLINELEKLKKEYGDLDVVVSHKDEFEAYVEPVKYIKYKNTFHNTIEVDTEDLDENYLEKHHESNNIIEKGLCVKIY